MCTNLRKVWCHLRNRNAVGVWHVSYIKGSGNVHRTLRGTRCCGSEMPRIIHRTFPKSEQTPAAIWRRIRTGTNVVGSHESRFRTGRFYARRVYSIFFINFSEFVNVPTSLNALFVVRTRNFGKVRLCQSLVLGNVLIKVTRLVMFYNHFQLNFF